MVFVPGAGGCVVFRSNSFLLSIQYTDLVSNVHKRYSTAKVGGREKLKQCKISQSPCPRAHLLSTCRCRPSPSALPRPLLLTASHHILLRRTLPHPIAMFRCSHRPTRHLRTRLPAATRLHVRTSLASPVRVEMPHHRPHTLHGHSDDKSLAYSVRGPEGRFSIGDAND